MAWHIVSIFCLLLIGTISDAKRIKIVGGDDTKIQYYPYQVSIRIKDVHDCGGAIISERHILTAAHCFMDFDENKNFFKVHTGTDKSNEPGNVHEMLSVHIHPNWTANETQGYPNDIAVITLKDSIVFDKYQQKINLSNHDPQNFEKAHMTGWGYTTNLNEVFPITLQKLSVDVLTSDTCKLLIKHKINPTQICGFRKLGTGTCYGDSGGALVSKGEVLGITSYGDEDDCAVGKPDIYTNVFAYKDFIESIMNK